jgi:hypothetical protein
LKSELARVGRDFPPLGHGLRDELAYPAAVEALQRGGDAGEPSIIVETSQTRVSLAEGPERRAQDLDDHGGRRERKFEREIGPRHECLVQGLREVRGRDGEDVRVLARGRVQCSEHCVGRAMNVGWVGAQGGGRAGYRHCLDLVEEHHGGHPVVG